MVNGRDVPCYFRKLVSLSDNDNEIGSVCTHRLQHHRKLICPCVVLVAFKHLCHKL